MPSPEYQAKVDEMALRGRINYDNWTRGPFGLSCMGYKRVSKPPAVPNVELQKMVEEKKRGSK